MNFKRTSTLDTLLTNTFTNKFKVDAKKEDEA